MRRRLRMFAALFVKEVLRLRYNRGVQLVLVLFLVMTAVIRFSEAIPGAAVPELYFSEGGDSAFARELRYYEGRLRFTRKAPPVGSREPVFIVSLPSNLRMPDARIVVQYPDKHKELARFVYTVLTQQIVRFLEVPLPVSIQMVDSQSRVLADPELPAIARRTTADIKSRKELSLILLTTLAVTVVSFNLFTIMFSEEKAGRLLLAQLLSPAGAGSVLVAKYLLYLIVTLTLVGIVGRIASPQATEAVAFWVVTALGSVAYMSLASLVVAFSDRQSTASLLSFGYLFLVGVVNLLSQELELFARVREELPETYLFGFLARLYGGNEVGIEEYAVQRFAVVSFTLFAFAWLTFRQRARR